MSHPKKPCPDCGISIYRESACCRACYQKRCVSRNNANRACPDCGQPMHRPYQANRCQSCTRKQRAAALVCPDCGGRKGRGESLRCGACYQFARKNNRDDIDGIMYSFNATAFRNLLNRSDVEWAPSLLAAKVGLHPETILRWLSGSRRPRVGQWHKVAAILAMESCTHCNGAGVLEPTKEGLTRITQSVSHHAVALPAAQPILHGAGWSCDPNTLQLTIGAATVRLTRQECRLVTTVAQAEQFVSGDYLPSGYRTHLSRLRAKCNAVGADLGNVIETVVGAGYRARLAREQEATG